MHARLQPFVEQWQSEVPLLLSYGYKTGLYGEKLLATMSQLVKIMNTWAAELVRFSPQT